MSFPTIALAATAMIFNAFIWGISWWPLQQMRTYGLHPLWASSFMYVAPLLGLLIWQGQLAWTDVRQQPQLLWLFLCSGLTNACFNWAVAIGDVVRVVLLFYLMPLWSILLARWLLHEAILPSALLRMGLALTGVMLVMQPDSMRWGDWHTWQVPWPHSLPDVLALLGGFFFAGTGVLLRKTAGVTATSSRILTMFTGSVCISGGTAWLLTTWIGEHIVPTPALSHWGQWLPWLLLSSLMFLLANMALNYGSQHLSAQRMSVLMLTEVLFASTSSITMGASHPTPHTLPGGVLIMTAALLAACADTAQPPQSPHAQSAKMTDYE